MSVTLNHYSGIQRLSQSQEELECKLGNLQKYHDCALLIFELMCNIMYIDGGRYRQSLRMENRQTKILDHDTVQHLGSLSKSQMAQIGFGALTAAGFTMAGVTMGGVNVGGINGKVFEYGAQAGSAAGQMTSPISNTSTSYYQAENKMATEKLRSDQQNISSVSQEQEKTLRQQQEASEKRSRIAGG